MGVMSYVPRCPHLVALSFADMLAAVDVGGVVVDVVIGVGGVIVIGVSGVVVVASLLSMFVSLSCIVVEASANNPPREQLLTRLDVSAVVFIIGSWCL